MAVGMDKTFVGIDHLLQVNGAFHVMGKGGFAIKVAIVALDLLNGGIKLYYLCGKNAARKVGTLGYLGMFTLYRWLKLAERLLDLWHVLVLKSFVDAHVACAPREMGGGPRLPPRSCRARDGINRNVGMQ